MTATEPAISVVPANEAAWADLQTVLGTRGPAMRCQCQRFKLHPRESFGSFPTEERMARLREQTDCGHPESDSTSRLVALIGSEPVGWCAVEPRIAYEGFAPRAGRSRHRGLPDHHNGRDPGGAARRHRERVRRRRAHRSQPPDPSPGGDAPRSLRPTTANRSG